MQFCLYLFTFYLTQYLIEAVNASSRFNVTVELSGNTTNLKEIPFKAVHVKYLLPKNVDTWNIVGIEPFISMNNDTIEYVNIYICHSDVISDKKNTIWYDDEKVCDNYNSMLIYEWNPRYSFSPFESSENIAFSVDKSKSIIFSVVYTQYESVRNDQISIVLHISTVTNYYNLSSFPYRPTFYLATILVESKQREMNFSCRLLQYPRQFYSIQPLFSEANKSKWDIHLVRNRMFRRRVVQLAVDSAMYSNQNRSSFDVVSFYLFVTSGDYIIIRCEPNEQSICKFLIYYMHKQINSNFFIQTNHTCDANYYPNLYSLLPKKTISDEDILMKSNSNMNGKMIIFIMFLLIFTIWTSIIIVCIIIRRVQGLVNFRSQGPTIVSESGLKTDRHKVYGRRDRQYQRTEVEGDRLAQIDIEHMGLMT